MHSRSRVLAVVVLIVAWTRPAVAQTPLDSLVALVNRGERQFGVSRYDSAMATFRAALTLSRAIGERLGEAATLEDIGVLYQRIGFPDSALAYAHAALPLRRAIGNPGGVATTLNNIGTVYYSTGHPDSALAYYKAALPLQHAAADRSAEAVTLNNIGVLYGFEGIGQPDSALAYYRAALPLLRALHDPMREATALDNIGKVYTGTGQADSALVYLRAALPLARGVGDRAGEARTLNNIGSVFGLTGQPDSMITYVRAALPLLHAMGNRAGEASALHNIGSVFDATGRLDSALAYYRAALELRRAVGDRDGEATTLSNIGLTYWRTGRPDSTLAYSRAALALLRAVGDRKNEAAALSNLAWLFQAAGHPDSALALIDSSVALLAAVRTHAGSDASAVAFAEQERASTDFWVRGWLARATHIRVPVIGRRDDASWSTESAVSAALAAAERGRAQGLRDLLARSGGAVGPTADAALWARDTVPGANLAAEAERELAPLRRTHSAALYYFLGSDTLTTWLLAPTGELRLGARGAVKSDSVAALVTTLRAALGADAARTRMARGAPTEQERTSTASRGVEDETSPEAQAKLRAATTALGTLLLPDALARAVPPGTDLVIVPHGVLGLVPFAALLAPGDTTPLGTRYALRYTPSLRALDAAEERTPSPGRALVVGDPSMPTVMGVDGRRVQLRDLPAARAEGDGVAHRFGVPALTGTAATETAVRRALPAARVVHLATHGLAYGTEARVRDGYVALAPDSANDGLLTIGELLDDVPSLSADLVVLSACQTGLGNLQQAEGTVGFQRALLAKGVRSVLVSLWSVDDRATALLMRQFYAHWLGADGKPARSKAEALRLAQNDVRRSSGFTSPRYWAAFQLVGAR